MGMNVLKDKDRSKTSFSNLKDLVAGTDLQITHLFELFNKQNDINAE